MPVDLLKNELESVSGRLEELESLLKAKPQARPLLYRSMAARYRAEIMNLREALNREDSRSEAAEHLRGLIEKIVLTPVSGQEALNIDLHGSLAGILSVASKGTTMKSTKEKRLRQIAVNDNYSPEPSIELVAGAGFEPTTFGL